MDTVDPDWLEGGDNFLLGLWMNGGGPVGTIADFEPTADEIAFLVPEDYLGGAVIDITAEGQETLLRMDGQLYARVEGAAGVLTRDMVALIFTPIVIAT